VPHPLRDQYGTALPHRHPLAEFVAGLTAEQRRRLVELLASLDDGDAL
jgi:hypothetical protein